jgi:catechol 1,2-dioxygenase
MKITHIEAIPFAIPYVKALRFASGEVRCAEHVLVRVRTDSGLVGTAEAPARPYTYGETQASIKAIIDTILAPQLVGMDPFEREKAHVQLNRTVANPTAKAAIDMALWDLIGQATGTSVTKLLGGYADRMRVAHMLGFDDPDAMVSEAHRIRDTYGITTFKIKVGRHPIALDVAACRALREALGPDVELYIDGNRGWTAAEAARALAELDGIGLSFAEELCPSDDLVGRRWLVSHSRIPMFADESATRPAEVTREVLACAAAGISIKTARTGFTYSHRVLALCEGLGVDVVLGNQIDGQIGSACSVAFGAAFPLTSRRAGELSNFLDMRDDLLTEPLHIANGELRIRNSPGLGIEIDEDKLAHYRMDTGHRIRTMFGPIKGERTMTHTAAAKTNAAATGAAATEQFRTDKSHVSGDSSPERVSMLAREVLEAVHATIRKHHVTYAEYDALKAWLIRVGADGEWPLFLDVFVEHVVEEVANEASEGSKCAIEGPFYVPGAAEFGAQATLPMRENEAGTGLLFQGQVRAVDRRPLAGATVDFWQADDAGYYSKFAPGIPEWNLRGRITTGEDGRFAIRTIKPAPYQIPTDGATGALIRAANWHAWRPAHLHLKVSAPGHKLMTTQLYFPGDPHNDDDIASAVKPELMLNPKPAAEGNGIEATYDFVLDPA